MKRNIIRLTAIVLILITKNAWAQDTVSATGTPAIVGEGTVSSTDFEFNFTTTASSDRAFFSKALLPDWRRISIVTTRNRQGQWQEPALVPYSGQFRDADPFIAPDQSMMIFISDRPSKYQKKPSDYSLWVVKPPFHQQQEPVLLEGDFYQMTLPLYPSLSAKNDLYFSALDSLKDSDIYFVQNQNGKYGSAIILPFNSPQHRDLDPAISPDGTFIIFTSGSRKGLGGTDLYVAFHNGGSWTEPVNLGKEVNSPGSEGQPGISHDGKTLYFTSNRPQEITASPRPKVITNKQFIKELQSPFNGLGNIWEVNIEHIHRLNPDNRN